MIRAAVKLGLSEYQGWNLRACACLIMTLTHIHQNLIHFVCNSAFMPWTPQKLLKVRPALSISTQILLSHSEQGRCGGNAPFVSKTPSGASKRHDSLSLSVMAESGVSQVMGEEDFSISLAEFILCSGELFRWNRLHFLADSKAFNTFLPHRFSTFETPSRGDQCSIPLILTPVLVA